MCDAVLHVQCTRHVHISCSAAHPTHPGRNSEKPPPQWAARQTPRRQTRFKTTETQTQPPATRPDTRHKHKKHKTQTSPMTYFLPSVFSASVMSQFSSSLPGLPARPPPVAAFWSRKFKRIPGRVFAVPDPAPRIKDLDISIYRVHGMMSWLGVPCRVEHRPSSLWQRLPLHFCVPHASKCFRMSSSEFPVASRGYASKVKCAV